MRIIPAHQIIGIAQDLTFNSWLRRPAGWRFPEGDVARRSDRHFEAGVLAGPKWYMTPVLNSSVIP